MSASSEPHVSSADPVIPSSRTTAPLPTLDHPAPTLPGARIAVFPSRLALLAEVAILALLLAIAIGMRAINLGAYSGLFDEGIRVEQLFLMSQGYRPFRDIFAAQGPLLLDLLYPLFRLYGGTIEAARMAVATYSLAGLLGVYWLARQLGGAVGGLAAMALLIASPLYLEGSRLALAEVTALAFAIPAVAAAVQYARSGARRWLTVAVLLLTVSLLVKPITIAAAVPVGLAVLSRGRAGLRDGLIVSPIAPILASAVILGVGIAGVLDQIVEYRLESRGSEGWSLAKNWRALQRLLAFEPVGVYALAAAGGIALLWLRRWPGLIAVGWALAGLGLLLGYSPLHGKHAVVLIPAVAAVGGAAIGAVLADARVGRRSTIVGLGVLLMAGLLAYIASAPAVLGFGGQLLRVTADTDVDPAIEQYADAVAVIRDLTTTNDFVVTDHPYLTFLAGRKVPPQLVDTAKARIRSRSLTANEAVTLAAELDPAMVVLWSDRLRPLRSFKVWVEDNYRLVKVYNRRNDLDRGIYVRSSGDLEGTRRVLTAGLTPIAPITFGDEIALNGYRVERDAVPRGEGSAVTFHWQALRRPSLDHHVVTYLRDADGRQWDAQEESLSGGSVPATDWPPGRWLVQQTFIVVNSAVPPGDYIVTAGLYDSRARRLTPPTSGSDSLEHLPSGEIVLARIRVE